MLTRLRVTGFKNLVDIDVSFGPFTCVAGANGVGKSNLFDAIIFLSNLATEPLVRAAQSVRDEGGRSGDIRSLFHRVGSDVCKEMRFEAEMILPMEAVDELGQTLRPTTTFVRYELVIGLRENGGGSGNNPLEIRREELKHINRGAASKKLLFPHSVKKWRNDVVLGDRKGTAYISTENKPSTGTVIKLHQDAQDKKGGGRAFERPASSLPRSVLSSVTGTEAPTALCARREMESWRLLQLEPSALRQPDAFSAPTHLDPTGLHLPATLYRIATQANAEQVYSRVANRLSELVGGVRTVRVERDETREILTLVLGMADGTELPARALSDGTLRFLALTVIEEDSEGSRLICLEEPENGIHPERIPRIIELLQDIAADAEEPPDETNPLRQVIINTHSPAVLNAVPHDDILCAREVPRLQGGVRTTQLELRSLDKTWRQEVDPPSGTIEKGQLLAYLNPLLAIRREQARGRQRLIDRAQTEWQFVETL
jgi:predicted ATPase